MMLPFDYSRCKPVEPDAYCHQCRRWAEHPAQTWGSQTTVVVRVNSRDEDCAYIAIEPKKD